MIKSCWYILSDSRVIGVADKPVNEEDMASQGYEVIASEVYEPNIRKIARIENSIPVFKPIVSLEILRNEDGSISVTPRGQSTTGTVTLLVYGQEFDIAINVSLTIIPIENEKPTITLKETDDIYIEYLGGAY